MLPEEGMQRFLDQVFELWINPELERRRADGTLADDFALQKAQIIFNIDQAPKVRINEEVKALAHLVVNRRIEKGEEIRHKDIEAISKVELTDEDPDAGHVTLINFAGAWHLTFDFIYNRTKIREALAAAEEFISVAKFAASEQNFRAFVENAFASAELLSKAFLMRMPNKRILHAKSHDLIFTNLDRHAKLGNVDRRFSRTFKKLRDLRPKARYSQEPFALDETEARTMIDDVERAISELCLGGSQRDSDQLAAAGADATKE